MTSRSPNPSLGPDLHTSVLKLEGTDGSVAAYWRLTLKSPLT